VQAIVAAEVARAAVELGGAGARGVLNKAAGGFAVLRLKVRGQHFHFGDSVRVHGDVLGVIGAGLNVGGAVDNKLFFGGAGAVDVETTQAVDRRQLPVNRAHDAGHSLHEVERIASVHRQIAHLPVRDYLRALPRFGLELKLSGIGGDSDGLHHPAD